jgi:hypothetical protein
VCNVSKVSSRMATRMGRALGAAGGTWRMRTT